MTRKFCKHSVGIGLRKAGKEVFWIVALYTIIRVYEVPADNQIQATDRMIEALTLHAWKRIFTSRITSVSPGKSPAKAERLNSNRLLDG
jgi:hypothetical protein